ncbi:glutamate receptor 2.8-like [Dioscorea cayenensis subsp. rotundata]|uniref:Glutamate receptor n=1 Tax=Dioscorea cayennensis subsp. rotundata TaxID=55577 RepID=A0AB40AKW2_DIOCR|nr:glutamate receptor 2.8-like [Dioscorea cayenensis subsp. rotundata]
MKDHLLFLIIFFNPLFLLPIFSGEPTPVSIGVVLDMNSSLGKTCFLSMKMAKDDFYTSHPDYNTRIVFKLRDSLRQVIGAADGALDLIKNEKVQAIIGPQTSGEAQFVGDLGEKAKIPIISFSATSPSISPSQSPFFLRTGLTDAAQSPAIASLIKFYGWHRLVPIYEDTDSCAGFIPSLIDSLLDADITVPYRTLLSKNSNDDHISSELYLLKTMQTRVFFVHMSTPLASRFFQKAEEAGMMTDDYVWIISEKLTSLIRLMNSSIIHDSMKGVIGLRPYVPKTGKLAGFQRRWRREFRREFADDADESESMILTTYGYWAYDTVSAVAMAVEAASPLDNGRVMSSNGKTDLSEISASKTGEKLLDAIRVLSFTGLAGKFLLVDGELNVSAFQVLNFNGDQSGREIGYWTPGAGLSRTLKGGGNNSESLGPVIWPGESTRVPKGWETPTGEKKLRIAVPGTVLPGFKSFLDIKMFEAAVKRLPYALPFEYFNYSSSDGKSTGSYDLLARQVADKKYDAVVADMTITSNRSEYVDFTLPYTVAGISMVVPIKNQRSKNAWIFVKPLTPDLWLVSLGFFVFTGSIIWVLEHRINPEFRGPPTNQIGTIFYFTFSILVFAHRENIVSNLARVVVIIWVFVVLILQSSYTASLTSLLTVEQFEPSYTHISELKDNGERVGYLKDSFVKGFLVKTWKFDQEKLIPFRSPQEYAEALAKGSRNGGVAAIIDEIPYLKVFLKDHCDNYTMAGQTYKTSGFGFVFPKGSPIVSDLSRAILNITEGDEMSDIERRWFGDQTNCPKLGSKLSSNSLDFTSFWGLFLITGTVSLLAFFLYWIIFLYKNRHQLMSNMASQSSLRWRLQSIGQLFDQRDLSSHTFRNAEVKDGSKRSTEDQSPHSSPFNNNCPQSPMSFSTSQTFEEGNVSTELATPNSETPLHVVRHCCCTDH